MAAAACLYLQNRSPPAAVIIATAVQSVGYRERMHDSLDQEDAEVETTILAQTKLGYTFVPLQTRSSHLRMASATKAS